MTAIEAALQLQVPFPDKDIEWRAQRSGLKDGKGWAVLLAYVTNRAIQDRLDEVMGIDKWRNEYEKAPDGGVMCGLSLYFDDWITKWDGAENTNVEAVKGGLSGAMKRAGSQWGIGRYLYNLDATIVSLSDTKNRDTDLMILVKEDNGKAHKRMYCARPKLPEWALPQELPTIEQLIKIKGLLLQAGIEKARRGIEVSKLKTKADADKMADFLTGKLREREPRVTPPEE